jgi:hypothetical protein
VNLPKAKGTAVSCCDMPVVNKYAGGATSSRLLQQRMAACNPTADRLALIRHLNAIPACTPATDTRFVQYERRGPPVPCTPAPASTIIPHNPGVPTPINTCFNVIGISQLRLN